MQNKDDPDLRADQSTSREGHFGHRWTKDGSRGSRGDGQFGFVTERRRHLFRLLTYAWTAPTTFPGLLITALTLATRGRCRTRDGILCIWGGFAAWLLSRRLFRAKAMALGHVVLATDAQALHRYWRHEREHVRQAERWGPLFLPAYLAASLWAVLTGRHYYRDNWFEKDAGPLI